MKSPSDSGSDRGARLCRGLWERGSSEGESQGMSGALGVRGLRVGEPGFVSDVTCLSESRSDIGEYLRVVEGDIVNTFTMSPSTTSARR